MMGNCWDEHKEPWVKSLAKVSLTNLQSRICRLVKDTLAKSLHDHGTLIITHDTLSGLNIPCVVSKVGKVWLGFKKEGPSVKFI
jgi:hypothetical protein